MIQNKIIFPLLNLLLGFISGLLCVGSWIVLYFSLSGIQAWILAVGACFSFVISVSFFTNYFYIKKINPSGKEYWTDPILLLSARGIDLHDLVEELTRSSRNIAEQILTINEEIGNLDSLIRHTNDDMAAIFQIVTQLANQEVTLIDDVGKTSEEIHFMIDFVNSVISEIDSRNENMKNLVNMSRSGGEKVKRTNSLIKHISEKADDMLKMVDFINKITKETNLLAINAAIEASHSDNEGKGFAVIADEMKKLAVLTSQKAKEISKLMKVNIEDYREAHRASEESGEAFHFISSEIHLVSGTIAEVVQTIEELKSRGKVVISKAEKLDESAESVKNSSGEVYGEIVNVNDTLASIQDLSQKIKKEMIQIQSLQETLGNKSERIRVLAKDIHDETDHFLGILKETPD